MTSIMLVPCDSNAMPVLTMSSDTQLLMHAGRALTCPQAPMQMCVDSCSRVFRRYRSMPVDC